MPEPDNDEISFEVTGAKDAPPVKDPNERALEDQVIRKLDREQTEAKVRQDLGLEKSPPYAPIPKDVPVLMFRFGSRIIKCPAFCLDGEDADLFSKHLNIICEHFKIGGVWWSIGICLMILVSKLIQCKDAIFGLFKGKEKPAEVKPDV